MCLVQTIKAPPPPPPHPASQKKKLCDSQSQTGFFGLKLLKVKPKSFNPGSVNKKFKIICPLIINMRNKIVSRALKLLKWQKNSEVFIHCHVLWVNLNGKYLAVLHTLLVLKANNANFAYCKGETHRIPEYQGIAANKHSEHYQTWALVLAQKMKVWISYQCTANCYPVC